MGNLFSKMVFGKKQTAAQPPPRQTSLKKSPGLNSCVVVLDDKLPEAGSSTSKALRSRNIPSTSRSPPRRSKRGPVSSTPGSNSSTMTTNRSHQRLERVSETPSMTPSPKPSRLSRRSSSSDSSLSSTPTPPSRKRRRGMTASPFTSSHSLSQTNRASSENPRLKTPPKRSLRRRNVSIRTNPQMNLRVLSSPSQRQRSSSSSSECSYATAPEIQPLVGDPQERVMAESSSPDTTWLLISVFSMDLGTELEDIFNSSSSVDRKKMTELFLKYVNGSWSAPDNINSLEFFAGRVVGSSKELDGEIYLLLAPAAWQDRNVGWKLSLKGLIKPCIHFTARVGYTLLLYGCTIDSVNQKLSVNSDNLRRNVYIFIHCKNGRSEPVRLDNESSCIYSSGETVSYFLPMDDEMHSSVVLTYANSPSVSCNAENRNDEQREITDERDIGSNKSGRARGMSNNNNDGIQNNIEDNIINIPADAVSFIRDTRGVPQDPEDVPLPPNINMDVDEMGYEDWIARGRFVPGNQRPKLRKVRPDEAYQYQSLKDLNDELQNDIRRQGRKGINPLMVLLEQKFAYGIVDEIVPTRFRQHRSYVVKISDETMDNVLLRICTSKMQPQEGPNIEVGQIIRIHRMTVQVEFDPSLQKHSMVLSTSPHHNYTLFYNEDNNSASNNIAFNSVAKTTTLNDDDKIRVRNLMTFRKNREDRLAAGASSPEIDSMSSNENIISSQDQRDLEAEFREDIIMESETDDHLYSIQEVIDSASSLNVIPETQEESQDIVLETDEEDLNLEDGQSEEIFQSCISQEEIPGSSTGGVPNVQEIVDIQRRQRAISPRYHRTPQPD